MVDGLSATTRDTTDEARIRVLPSDLIDRIAAGEVIERPASVVKELVENAIDAGARHIKVDVVEGGLSRIAVEDDGRGMSPRDAKTSLLRHATSKLAHHDDLFAIRTLGFRGEALSSIASISRLTLTTRRALDVTATRIRAVAGEVESVTEVGAPVGTCIEVDDLFFNTPARRKFMRSPATEQAHVVEAALRVVLGASECGIVVTNGERRLLDVPEDATDEARLIAALGAKVDKVYPFSLTRDDVHISGYVTDPEAARGDTKGLWFFVNGRFVRDRMLQRAVLDGYRSLVERGRYPVCVVHIEVAADAVDVNVHPQKLEVRFRDGQVVFRVIGAALTGVLSGTPWMQGHLAGVRRATEAYFEKEPEPWRYPTAPERPVSSIADRPREPSHYVPMELPLDRQGYFAGLTPIGEALGRYIVCEGEGDLVLIDERAAHQRIAYERLRRETANGTIASQPLLFPETIAASTELEEHWESLAAYGFEIEPVGPERFAVRGLPAPLVGADVTALVAELIASMGASQDEILARCARHAPALTGTIDGLLAALDESDGASATDHCPPVHRSLTTAEVEKLF
ncbi:MAG TPA: DNA mismatch repair endonuclease MutL [Myxococcota bacterium]|nr:DNA mismatch repair endonuclease MutL [Myxococcota bacterium]